MKRYAAFLRGVMPTNASMPALKAAFEAGGFVDVRTVLGSGNVVFGARAAPIRAIERRAEAAMDRHLGHAFLAIVRPVDGLSAMLASDPYRPFRLEPGSKRIVTFLRSQPEAARSLPIALDGARILRVEGGEVFSAYVVTARGGPAFMTLIERTFGKAVTTRTWETVTKVVAAGTM